MSQKEKIINEKGPGQKKSGQNTMEKPRSEFMKEYDTICAKDLRANIEKPPNEDFENDEVTDDDNL